MTAEKSKNSWGQKFLGFIGRLFNSIRYNFFYILLSTLFPYIIFKLDAGAEIIRSMTETDFSINLSLSVLAFTALAFSVWCVPTVAIRIFRFFTRYHLEQAALPDESSRIDHCLFKQLIFIYNGSDSNEKRSEAVSGSSCNDSRAPYRQQISVRYFAIIPWVLFISTCIAVFAESARYPSWVYVVLFMLVTIVFIVVLDYSRKKVNRIWDCFFSFLKQGKVARYQWTIFVYFLVFAVASVALYYLHPSASLLRVLTLVVHSCGLVIFYSFILYLESIRLSEKTSFRLSNVNYWAIILYVVVSIVVYFFLNRSQQLQYISPVIVLTTMSTFLIVFAELFITSQLLLTEVTSTQRCNCSECLIGCISHSPDDSSGKIRTRTTLYRYFVYLVLVAVLNWYFLASCNTHLIRREVVKAGDYISDQGRPSLTDYFKQWFDRRKDLLDDDSVVYLISGQGGGSRAASWFFMNMARRESKDPSFFRKVFSISTVSGSSSGANMYLAAKMNHVSLLHNEDSVGHFAEKLYGRNYMSSAFYGLLLGDAVESVLSLASDFPKDRNYHLQEEELYAYEKTFGKDTAGFLTKDYLYHFIKNARDTGSPMLPLFLINTAIVDFGTRGIFSPVPLKTFSLAKDLYGLFKTRNRDTSSNIPMVTCVNQSQAFPIISAYNYMDSVGRFIDGGLYENSGCATTLEIYQALRVYCDAKPSVLKNVRFICLNITNGPIRDKDTAEYKAASIVNTISAVVNSPFGGHQTFAFNDLQRQVDITDTSLKHKDSVRNLRLTDTITLTRTMSSESVEKMYKILYSEK